MSSPIAGLMELYGQLDACNPLSVQIPHKYVPWIRVIAIVIQAFGEYIMIGYLDPEGSI